MDPTEEPEDGTLPLFGVNNSGDFAALYTQRMEAADRAAKSEADLRRQTYERALQQIEANQYSAPSQSEQLLQLSQALLSPTRMRGFAGLMNNVMPVLSEQAAAKRKAEEQRAAQLMQLRQQYAMQQASGTTAAAQAQLEALKPLVPLYKPGTQSMGTWSENLGRYIPKDRPVVVKTGTLNGKRVESLSDGTMRMYDSAGNVSLFDAGGNPIPTGGQ